MTANFDIETRIRQSFAKQSFMSSAGAKIVAVEPGMVAIEALVGNGYLQQHGFAHAGLTFAIGDSAAGYAALTSLPAEAEVMTVEMKINLLAPAYGLLRAEGRVVRAGSRVTVVAAEVFCIGDEGGKKPVAVMQGTMISA